MTSQLSKKFDDWLHAFFLERFGTIVSKNDAQSRKEVSHRHRGLERLRKKKKSLTKAFKTLVKAGLADSPLGNLAKNEWKKTR